MTKPLTKEELIRGAWITALRREGGRQCRMLSRQGTQVCALALLAEISKFGLRNPKNPDHCDYNAIAATAGLGHSQASAIIHMNDWSRLTFSEIADIVEGWFKKSNEGVGELASRNQTSLA